jgi:LysM repeat protein
MGLALLLSIPLLALILIRMLWSGSTLWFLMIGIICLGSAAVLLLARRNDPYARHLADEPNRVPLVLMGVGALFLGLLVLPNFGGGGDGPAGQVRDDVSSLQPSSQVSGVSQPPRSQPTAIPQTNSQSSSSQTGTQTEDRSQVPLQPAVEEEPEPSVSEPVIPEGSTTYVVQEGDTLWDIAEEFGTTVDDIIAANALDDPGDIQVDQELYIPPPSEDPLLDEEITGADDEVVE